MFVVRSVKMCHIPSHCEKKKKLFTEEGDVFLCSFPHSCTAWITQCRTFLPSYKTDCVSHNEQQQALYFADHTEALIVVFDIANKKIRQKMFYLVTEYSTAAAKKDMVFYC